MEFVEIAKIIENTDHFGYPNYQKIKSILQSIVDLQTPGNRVY